MGANMNCPNCGAVDLDVHGYESMIVVTAESALFTVRCQSCGTRVSGLRLIPADMLEVVQYAAIEVGAGMGRER